MSKYKVIESENGSYIERTDDDGKKWSIPFADDNADYQRYLRWLENPDAELGGTL